MSKNYNKKSIQDLIKKQRPPDFLYPSYHEPFFRNAIEKNRYYFLQEMERKYSLKIKKPRLWRGTALHLLELSGFISPDMHRAANYYFEISNHMLKDGPQVALSKIFQKPCASPWHKGSYARKINEAQTEKKWRDMTKILEQDNIKNILDTLADDRDLPTFEYLIQTDKALIQLQQRLNQLQSYLAETSFY